MIIWSFSHQGRGVGFAPWGGLNTSKIFTWLKNVQFMDQPSINAKSTVSRDKQVRNKLWGAFTFIYCFDSFRNDVYFCWFIRVRRIFFQTTSNWSLALVIFFKVHKQIGKGLELFWFHVCRTHFQGLRTLSWNW